MDMVNHLRKYSEVCLKFRKLGESKLHLQDNSDASFATNYDKSSQLGYIIIIVNGNDQYQSFYWNSYESVGLPGLFWEVK